MMRQARKGAFIFLALLAGWGGAVEQARASGETMYDYTKIPAFLEVGLNPNLLMVIDNSASMYDPAYAPANDNYCYDDTYDPNVAYAGYFDSSADKWYYYLGSMWSQVTYANWGFYSWPIGSNKASCDGWNAYASPASAIYGSSDLCLMMDETVAGAPKVNLAVAKGRYLNWLISSKFDVEKEILTGGKYSRNDAEGGGVQMVAESRGCLDKRFIKKTPVTKGGVTYQATFGVRPPTVTEKVGDTAYNGAVSNTRIEIFKPTIAGFSFDPCKEAIDVWTDPAAGLGTVKLKTTACMEAAGASNITASHTAFNHILQECWYYKDNGEWQPGAGTVNSLQNDCRNVYGAASGSVAPLPAGYKTPNSLSASDVCSGQYDPSHPVAGPWGSNYVGQCWEEDFTVPMVPATCLAGSPVSAATAIKDTNNYWYYCNGGLYTRCGKNALNACKAPDWAVWYVPGAGSPLPTKVYWTDDNGDGGYACVDQALKKYCVGLDEVTVVDSTQVNDPQGTAWGIPAVLLDTAVVAQLGNPLLTMKGLVRTNSTKTPTGLIQEFKYNLRMGAMRYNPGPVEECTPVLRPDGTYRASLYDCLQDKGELINAFSLPDTTKLNGGKVVRPIDDGDVHINNLVTAINGISATAWTPMAEAYFEAVGYYTQKNSFRLNAGDYVCDQDGLTAPASYPAWAANTAYAAGAKVRFAWDYDNNGLTDETKVYFTDLGGTSSVGVATIEEDTGVRWTPFDPVLAGCQKNNILLITDGGSTADLNSTMTDFVRTAGNNDGDSAVTYSAGFTETGEYECKTAAGLHNLYGTSLLDDLSFYANRNDSDIFAYPTVDNLDKQPITTYVVAAGTLQDDGTGYDCNPKTQLQQVAANSGTTLIESTNPAQLESDLREIFEAIGGEPASGSAASVISNSRSGEGAIYQAVFYPKQVDSFPREIKWAGDVHSLWLDDHGNIREDCGASDCTSQDFKLVPEKDTIITFYTDPINSSARAKRYSDANGDGRYTEADLLEDNVKLSELHYIWSAGEWLGAASPAQKLTYGTTTGRYIFTSHNGSTVVPFTPSALAAPLVLGADYPGYFKAGTVAEADKIINYIRGEEQTGYRSRLIDWDGNGATEIWKLGDIVHSTPTVVSQPAEDYDVIYDDESYQAFRQRYRERRTVIYAGGNDGGLHAFNGGYYDRATKTFIPGPPGKVQYALGTELWMFIPKNLWPHLKWLTAANYSHVFYVDQKPYIFDAKIFQPDADHPHGWGTVLVGGMRFGGGNIGVDPDGDGTEEIMRSAYFIMDITNPETPPRLLAEFTRPDLGFTTVAPTAIPMLRGELGSNEMDWYLAFGSGPHSAGHPNSALAGESDQLAKLFIYPLGGTAAAGGLGYVGTFAPAVRVKSFSAADAATFSSSYFSDIIAVDFDLDYKTDALYFGSVGKANLTEHSDHIGGVHRLHTGENLDPLLDGEELNPDNWELNTFFATPGNQPVTASPSVAWDGKRAWVFVGTGNYFSALHDKPVLAQQSYYGLKERYDIADKMLLDLPNGGNLVDVSNVTVTNKVGTLSATLHSYQAPNFVTPSGDLTAGTFDGLNLEMSDKLDGLDKYHGWKLDFDLPGERNLGQAAILGNIVTFTTFVPSEDVCRPEGNSYLWAPYYRTGTAYDAPVIGKNGEVVLVKVDIGVGLATTPNIREGGGGGEEGGVTEAFVQTSTGAIIGIEQDNPGVVKSGMQSWRELSN